MWERMFQVLVENGECTGWPMSFLCPFHTPTEKHSLVWDPLCECAHYYLLLSKGGKHVFEGCLTDKKDINK